MTESFRRCTHRSKNIQIKSVTPGSKLSNPLKTNQYELKVKFMFGDADAYDTETYYIIKEQETLMIDFINFLLRCMSAFPNGMRSCDARRSVPGYDIFVLNEELDAQDETLVFMEEGWPCQEYQGEGEIDEISLFFYDEVGVKRKVEMNEVGS